MDEAGEIVAISVPFASGVAFAALAAQNIPFHLEYIIAVAASALCCGILFLCIEKGRSIILTSALFLMLGLFCWISRDLSSSELCIPWVKTALAHCLDYLKATIDALPLKHHGSNALISALITGDRSGLSSEDIKVFRDSGASHILALSGLHLGIIYLAISKLLSILGNSPCMRAVKSAGIILFSGTYTIMTGAGPSIMRAFLFIMLNETGKLTSERKRNPVRTLLAALTLQLALKPSVISSLGFQLSYLAMAGIVILYPSLSSWYPKSDSHSRLNPIRRIWDCTALAVSCQCFTAPLVWLRFHTFPEYFIITNLLAMPLTSAIMFLSLAVICLHCAGISIGCAYVAIDCMAQGLLSILESISSLP